MVQHSPDSVSGTGHRALGPVVFGLRKSRLRRAVPLSDQIHHPWTMDHGPWSLVVDAGDRISLVSRIYALTDYRVSPDSLTGCCVPAP